METTTAMTGLLAIAIVGALIVAVVIGVIVAVVLAASASRKRDDR